MSRVSLTALIFVFGSLAIVALVVTGNNLIVNPAGNRTLISMFFTLYCVLMFVGLKLAPWLFSVLSCISFALGSAGVVWLFVIANFALNSFLLLMLAIGLSGMLLSLSAYKFSVRT
ncbi:hypothetical protein [Vibrio parahaemolyticus]|uniref:hypothetical protein n=1 Tax=Vibrio parahaemolyticus TaxID=670 RepID=UPI00235F701F|nr:hypothetical protein [Vibrio parahaemolyticus]